MSLHDVAGKWIDPDKAEASEHIQCARRELPQRTFDKICRTIDAAIEEAAASGRSLVWMNTASLVGHGAPLRHDWHEHLWRSICKVYSDSPDPVAEKARRITVGAWVKWRTSLRPEPWLVHWRETGKADPVSGGEIFAGEYWICTAPPVVRLERRRGI
jgi:hypothetical protein